MNMDNLKQTLLTNWHPMRWVALVIGVFFIGQGFIHWDGLSGLLGAFMLFQVATNTGCLVGQNCSIAAEMSSESKTNKVKEVEFTEFKGE
jgi:hypothetical protein